MRSDTATRVHAPAGLIAERYRLLGPLGAGASATVWAAMDETLGRQVALKLLSGPAAFDEVEREQLRSEARALAALAHPRVIVVFDYLETPGADVAVQPVLVTELLEGRNLAACLEDGPLPWQSALAVCGQLAEALNAAHQAGIVHRDVTPANVMLTGSGVKLLDFGIAQRPAERGHSSGPAERGHSSVPAQRGHSDGVAVGTPVCMAPEQLTGQAAVPASDVYAFGCVLHWCLTGRPPYQDKDMAALSAAHLRAAPPPMSVPGLPKGIVELYLACLAKDPARRPSARQVARALAPYAPGSAAERSEPGPEPGPGESGPQNAAQEAPAAEVDATVLLPAFPAGGAGVASLADAAETLGAPTSHAGRRRPISRRQVLPAALLATALIVVVAIVFGLAHAVTGGDSAGSNPAGTGLSASSAPSASAATTAPAVNLPVPGASASATPSASASTPSESQSPSAPDQLVVPPLPDPGTDPIGYLQGVAAQIQAMVSQGPDTLQAGAGAQLRGQIADLENAVAAAQQAHGRKQWRGVQAGIAAIQQQISDDAAAGWISQAAANLLSGEMQRLAGQPSVGG